MTNGAAGGAWAVVVAAGRGERLGADVPKAFAPLAGRPLLAESLDRLEASDWVEGIVVVAPPGWEEPTILLAEELGAGKAGMVVPGGASRSESVRIGVAEVPRAAAVILVHDAARPLLPAAVVDRVVAALGEGFDGGVPALPVADTVKRAGDDRVVAETVDRSGLWAVQTPQGFVAATFREIVERGGEGSDCSSLVEAAGGRVRLVDGDPRLLKVTTADDLAIVEALVLAERGP
jgi:2-C-methyl-D-erythritol 4-phosphate cytidylyltransferase